MNRDSIKTSGIGARSFHLLILVLCVFGVGLGMFTRYNEFKFYYHPDEPGKVRQLVNGTRNFNHPMLMLTTVDAVRKLVLDDAGQRNYQTVVVVGRWATAAAAALTAAALALLAAWHYGLLAGVLTGVLTLSNSLLFQLAHYLKEDPWLTAGITLSAVSLYAFQRKPDTKRLCLLAVATGLTASAKYVGIALLPMVLFAVWRLSAAVGSRQRRVWLGQLLLIFALVWLTLNHWILITPGVFRESLGGEVGKAYENNRQGQWVSLVKYISTQRETGGWWTPILSLLWLVWAVFNARRVTAAEWLLGGISMFYLVVFIFTPKDASRYYLPVAVAFSYFAVAGVMVWARQLRRRAVLWTGVALVLGAVAIQSRVLSKEWKGYKWDNRVLLEEYIARNLPASAVIAQDDVVALPDPSLSDGRGHNRRMLPQRIIGSKLVAGMGDAAQLRSMGVTHVALSYGIYRTYLDGSRKDSDGSVSAVRHNLNSIKHGEVIWTAKKGYNNYVQPELWLVDITGTPATAAEPARPESNAGPVGGQ
ncbi:MAG: phospholipid carrier-dependent glycosyltransferase [Verrucomicrobiaceae bacterium]|nr:MAG: phospholipid carrier-dependent glycosyltransferase [Verrucomicrobiaceae bacterium]